VEIAQYVPSNLRDLCIQCIPNAHAVDHLRGLKRLQPVTPFFYVKDQIHDEIFAEWDDFGISENLLDIIGTLDLQRLLLLSVDLMPLRVFGSLVDLEICVPSANYDLSLVGLDLVLRHSPCLESLSLVGWIGRQLSSLLPHQSSDLPRLTSFRLSCEPLFVPQTAVVAAVGEFLQGRSSLRRLYLRLSDAPWSDISCLLPILHELPELRVLGLHTGHEMLNEVEITHLADHLSGDLEAFHLAIAWDQATMNVHSLSTLRDKFSLLPSLTFLHLFGVGDQLPIEQEELATELGQLQVLGLQRSIWDIDRINGEVILTAWKPWKVKFFVAEDFRCEDFAWLFKYH